MPDPIDFNKQEQESFLRQAIRANDVARIRLELTDIKPGVNIDSLLYSACEEGMLEGIQALLPECADPIPADCLQAAAENGHWPAAEFLLSVCDVAESGVLGFAASAGQLSMVQRLIKEYPEVIAEGSFWAIQQAAAANHPEVITALLPQVSLEDLSIHLRGSEAWSIADTVAGLLSPFDRTLWLEKFQRGMLPVTEANQRQEEALARPSPPAVAVRPRFRN